MRFFSYVWRGTLGRSVRTASGENVYRKLRCVCDDVIGAGKKGFSCDRCKGVHPITLDLGVISPNSYSPGQVIIGDLDKLGWVVI